MLNASPSVFEGWNHGSAHNHFSIEMANDTVWVFLRDAGLCRIDLVANTLLESLLMSSGELKLLIAVSPKASILSVLSLDYLCEQTYQVSLHCAT